MTQETIYQKIVSIIQERQGKSFEVTPELSFKDYSDIRRRIWN